MMLFHIDMTLNIEMTLEIKEPNHIKCRRRTDKFRTVWEVKISTPTEVRRDIYNFISAGKSIFAYKYLE